MEFPDRLDPMVSRDAQAWSAFKDPQAFQVIESEYNNKLFNDQFLLFPKAIYRGLPTNMLLKLYSLLQNTKNRVQKPFFMKKIEFFTKNPFSLECRFSENN